MLLGLLSFLTCWGGIFLLVKLQQKLSKLKTYVPKDTSVTFEKRIAAEKAERLRILYEKVFSTLDIRKGMAVMTDLFINEVNLRLKVYNRLGITRQIIFVPFPEKERSESLSVVNSGKFTITNEQAQGSYKEQFIDSSTGIVLWERDWPKSTYNFRLIRNPEAAQHKERYCEGCGAPVELEGEIYICKSCGAKYSADSYEWMISGVMAWNEGIVQGASNETSTLYNLIVKRIMPYGCMAMSILGFFSGGNILLKILTVLAILCNLMMYGVSAMTIVWAYTPVQKLVNFDQMASPQKVADRAAYLMSLMYGSYQTNPARMQPFMEPECYRQWRENLRELEAVQQSGSQVFHWETKFGDANLRKFWVSGGKQHLLVGGLVEYWYLTEGRKAQHAQQYHYVVLCRNKDVRYSRAMDVECHHCANCGMPIDFTADGKCRFCGSEHDIAQFDWKIEKIHCPSEALMDFVEKHRLPIPNMALEKEKQEMEKGLREQKALPPHVWPYQLRHYREIRQKLNAEAAAPATAQQITQ